MSYVSLVLDSRLLASTSCSAPRGPRKGGPGKGVGGKGEQLEQVAGEGDISKLLLAQLC